MSRFTTWNGSPVLLAAALVVALGLVGTAVAERDNSSAGLSRADVKRIVHKQIRQAGVKKIMRKQVRRLAPKLSVARAKRANRADVAQNAVVAQSAAVAERAEIAEYATRASLAPGPFNADTVNGMLITPVEYEQKPGSASQTIFAQGGLTLRAACSADGQISVTATTSLAGSSIFSSAVDTNSNDNNSNADQASGTFGVGDHFDLLAGSGGDPALITFSYETLGAGSLVGTLTVDEQYVIGSSCRVRGIVSSGSGVHYDME